MKNRALSVVLPLVGLGLPTAANAAVPFGFLPASLASAGALRGAATSPCTPQPSFGLGGGAVIHGMSKSAALLGGAPSQLDLIMRQQSGAAVTAAAAALPQAPALASVSALCSEAQGFAIAAPLPGPMTGSPAVAPFRSTRPEDFLGSRRLPISHTAFDADWARVSERALPGRMTRGLALISGEADRHSRIAAVNAWANAHIRYVEDQQLYRKADFWADARTTLKAGAGDCEDIAILKMQLLAAAGIPRDAMFLTIARDLARRADHALLVVRDGDKYWLLDNATNTLVDANAAVDYRPIMSFGEHGKWLHGY